MKNLIFFSIVVILSLCSCKSTYLKSTGDQFCLKLQFYKIGEKKLVTIKDTTNIYYYNDVVIYEKPYKQVSLPVGKREINIDTLKQFTKYHYLIFNKSESYGIWLDSIPVKQYKKVNIDSFKTNNFLEKLSVHKSAYNVLVSSVQDTNRDFFTEKYTLEKKIDQSYFDTVCFSFKRKTNLRFSLDHDFEEEKQARLIKEVFIYNRAWNETMHDTIPKREFKLELKEIPESKLAAKALKRYLSIIGKSG